VLKCSGVYVSNDDGVSGRGRPINSSCQKDPRSFLLQELSKSLNFVMSKLIR
jgi:hypothetical protein